MIDNEREVDLKLDAFQRMLPDVLAGHQGQFALLRHQEIIDYFANLRAALAEVQSGFSDNLFSVQEVTDRPADLGFFSHAVDPGSLSGAQPLVPILIAPVFVGGAFQSSEFTALIDTGATKTCVTRTVVEQLGLQSFSKILVATPSGVERRKAYGFTVGFFNDGDGAVGAARSPFYFPDAITGAGFVRNSNFDVLLGMDILSQGRLIFDRGRFGFTFN